MTIIAGSLPRSRDGLLRYLEHDTRRDAGPEEQVVHDPPAQATARFPSTELLHSRQGEPPEAGASAGAPPARPQRSRGLIAAWSAALCLAIYVLIGGASLTREHSGLLDLATLSPRPVAEAVGQVTLDVVGENARVGYHGPPGALPICRSVERRHVPALTSAFALMRGTDEGQRLFQTLVDHDVCVGAADIPYNGAYASAWPGEDGDWSRSSITVDNDYLRSGGADALAAILVHEATHIDRAISGTNCGFTNDCTTLSNGVDVEEEVAAHAAEAEWWIAAFGKDGKRFAYGPDYGENKLVEAYLDGPDAFRAYIIDLRDDPREGEGI